MQFSLPRIVAVDQYDNILTNDYGATAYSGAKAITYSLLVNATLLTEAGRAPFMPTA